jgi:cation:H+ antiporter
MVIKLLFFTIGIFSLYYGADWFVKGSSRIAAIFKITPMVIGMTVVAFGTSAPELGVSLIATLKKEPDITLGNVIGSNIANIGLVLGASALVSRLDCAVKTIKWEIYILIGASCGLFWFAHSKDISFWEGVILFLGIVAFVLISYKSMIREGEQLPEDVKEDYIKLSKQEDGNLPLVVTMMVAGLGILLLGAHLVLDSAVYIAEEMGISRKLIALSMVAVGTSCPKRGERHKHR